jgi:hypothetical protein
MANFYDTVIRNSQYWGHDTVCKDMAMLEPGTRAAVVALMAEAKADGIDLRVLETYRSQTRQSALFMKHFTQLRVVGCHGYGVACDFGVFVNGEYAENNKPYVFLRELARRHGLISGQDWGHSKEGGFVDSGHVQRVPVWRQGQLFSDAWYPPAVYDPYQDSVEHHRTDVVLDIPGFKPAPVHVQPPVIDKPPPEPKPDDEAEWLAHKATLERELDWIEHHAEPHPKT